MIELLHPDNVVTVDFESRFSDAEKLGFKHQSTEEYIRDPRWLTYGVGVKKGSNPSLWLYGHKKVAEFFRRSDFKATTMLAHNAKFDGLVLSHHYDVRPQHWVDTRSLASMMFGNNLQSTSLAHLTKLLLPGEDKDQRVLFDLEGRYRLSPEEAYEMGEYCKGDCDKAHMLYSLFYRWMKGNDEARDFNLLTVDFVTRMFTDPMLELDPDPLAEVLAIEESEKQAALDLSVATNMVQVRSNKQLATLLQSHGVTPPTKISPTTGKETYAFAQSDPSFVKLVDHDNPAVANLVKARLRIKTSIMDTRARSYLGVAQRGTWPVDLNLSGARTTHRLSGGSGGGGNPQNLGRGSKLRKAVMAPRGFQMMSVDSTNVELRIAMALARESEVLSALWDPTTDLYVMFAAQMYGKVPEDVTKHERLCGKIAMLSLQYGTGWGGYMNAAYGWGVELEAEEAMRVVALYRATFPHIVATWKQLDYVLAKLERGQQEGWWNDRLVFANPNTTAGCAGFTMPATGLSITYPKLRYQRDGDERRELVYSRYNQDTHRLEDARLWGAKCFENICQALARNVVFGQQLKLDRYLKEEVDPACRTVMSIHDESLCLIPDHIHMDKVCTMAEKIFSESPKWWPELPVFGEAHAGATYADCK